MTRKFVVEERQCYSVRRASIGSSEDARRAGITPESKPVTKLTSKAARM